MIAEHPQPLQPQNVEKSFCQSVCDFLQFWNWSCWKCIPCCGDAKVDEGEVVRQTQGQGKKIPTTKQNLEEHQQISTAMSQHRKTLIKKRVEVDETFKNGVVAGHSIPGYDYSMSDISYDCCRPRYKTPDPNIRNDLEKSNINIEPKNLVTQSEIIPPTKHFSDLNPQIQKPHRLELTKTSPNLQK